MKTVQMTLDEELVAAVDKAAQSLGDDPLGLRSQRVARSGGSLAGQRARTEGPGGLPPQTGPAG